MEIEAVVAVADSPDSKGVVLPADALRKMADGKTHFWDESRQALLYRGPLPTASKGVHVWKCMCGRMNPWHVMECWECKHGRDSAPSEGGGK